MIRHHKFIGKEKVDGRFITTIHLDEKKTKFFRSKWNFYLKYYLDNSIKLRSGSYMMVMIEDYKRAGIISVECDFEIGVSIINDEGYIVQSERKRLRYEKNTP